MLRKLKNLDAFLVTNPINSLYLTGFKGVSPAERESILVLTDKKHLIVPKLYQSEAKLLESQDIKVEVVEERNKYYEQIAKLLANTPDVKSSRHPGYTPGAERIGLER